MTSLTALHLTGPLAREIEALGWSADDAMVRDGVPTAARGHNLVAVVPPSARYAAPTLAGWLSGLVPGTSRGILLCPAPSLDEWADLAGPLTRAAGFTLQVSAGVGRAASRLRRESPGLLVASPETALTLLHRSAFKGEAMTHLALAWPEWYEGEEVLAEFLQGVPRESQRVIWTSDLAHVGGLIERHVRKAAVVGGSAQEPVPFSAARPVRSVLVPWGGRAAAVARLADILDPDAMVVWAADSGSAQHLTTNLRSGLGDVRVVTGDAPTAPAIIAVDPPTTERLRQLVSAGPVVLMVPPLALAYLDRIAPGHRAMRLPGTPETAAAATAARRAAIATALDKAPPMDGLLALAPLFDEYDPASIAAALYRLWLDRPEPAPQASAPVAPATAKIWVGIGRKDQATPDDLVACLIRELQLDRSKIGKIEVREVYTLVEIPAQDAERVAQQLNGITIRRRRVAARVDRGATRRTGAKR